MQKSLRRFNYSLSKSGIGYVVSSKYGHKLKTGSRPWIYIENGQPCSECYDDYSDAGFSLVVFKDSHATWSLLFSAALTGRGLVIPSAMVCFQKCLKAR